MLKRILALGIITFSMILTGCAKVDMAPETKSLQTKQFKTPPKGKSGIYIYRDSFFGAGVSNSLYIDDKLIGKTAPYVFLYKEVNAGKHKIFANSSFGTDEMSLTTESGKNYYIRNYIRMGFFSGGANLEKIEETKAQKEISKLDLSETW